MQAAHAKAAATNDELKAKLAEARAARADEEDMLDDAGESREEVVARKSELETETKRLQKELAAYSDSDPTELERKRKEVEAFKKEASDCTDNIYSMESWFGRNDMKECLQNLQQELYGNEVDEDGELRDLVL